MLVDMSMRGLALRALLILALCCALVGIGERVYAAQPTQPAQEQFLPLDQLPPEDQLAAAPLLIAAYAVIWVLLLLYLWSIRRRLDGVQRELVEVARRVSERGRNG
jgi:CcmD family protein